MAQRQRHEIRFESDYEGQLSFLDSKVLLEYDISGSANTICLNLHIHRQLHVVQWGGEVIAARKLNRYRNLTVGSG